MSGSAPSQHVMFSDMTNIVNALAGQKENIPPYASRRYQESQKQQNNAARYENNNNNNNNATAASIGENGGSTVRGGRPSAGAGRVPLGDITAAFDGRNAQREVPRSAAIGSESGQYATTTTTINNSNNTSSTAATATAVLTAVRPNTREREAIETQGDALFSGKTPGRPIRSSRGALGCELGIEGELEQQQQKAGKMIVYQEDDDEGSERRSPQKSADEGHADSNTQYTFHSETSMPSSYAKNNMLQMADLVPSFVDCFHVEGLDDSGMDILRLTEVVDASGTHNEDENFASAYDERTTSLNSDQDMFSGCNPIALATALLDSDESNEYPHHSMFGDARREEDESNTVWGVSDASRDKPSVHANAAFPTDPLFLDDVLTASSMQPRSRQVSPLSEPTVGRFVPSTTDSGRNSCSSRSPHSPVIVRSTYTGNASRSGTEVREHRLSAPPPLAHMQLLQDRFKRGGMWIREEMEQQARRFQSSPSSSTDASKYARNRSPFQNTASRAEDGCANDDNDPNSIVFHSGRRIPTQLLGRTSAAKDSQSPFSPSPISDSGSSSRFSLPRYGEKDVLPSARPSYGVAGKTTNEKWGSSQPTLKPTMGQNVKTTVVTTKWTVDPVSGRRIPGRVNSASTSQDLDVQWDSNRHTESVKVCQSISQSVENDRASGNGAGRDGLDNLVLQGSGQIHRVREPPASARNELKRATDSCASLPLHGGRGAESTRSGSRSPVLSSDMFREPSTRSYFNHHNNDTAAFLMDGSNSSAVGGLGKKSDGRASVASLRSSPLSSAPLQQQQQQQQPSQGFHTIALLEFKTGVKLCFRSRIPVGSIRVGNYYICEVRCGDANSDASVSSGSDAMTPGAAPHVYVDAGVCVETYDVSNGYRMVPSQVSTGDSGVILRIATKEDCNVINNILPTMEEKAFQSATHAFESYGIPAVCSDVEYTFDRSRCKVLYAVRTPQKNLMAHSDLLACVCSTLKSQLQCRVTLEEVPVFIE